MCTKGLNIHGVVGNVPDDAEMQACNVDDGSGQHNVKFLVDQVGSVRRSTNCYVCGPCTTRGMRCKNMNRLDYYII